MHDLRGYVNAACVRVRAGTMPHADMQPRAMHDDSTSKMGLKTPAAAAENTLHTGSQIEAKDKRARLKPTCAWAMLLALASHAGGCRPLYGGAAA